MEILGYKSLGIRYGFLNYWINNNIQKCLDKVVHFEFLKDWPWRQCYQIIDQKYSNCKFILTLRDPNKWVNSYIKHIQREKLYNRHIKPITVARIKAYGFDPLKYMNQKEFLIKNIYEKQNQEIRDYFRNRNQDLLEVDLTINPSFSAICGFLHREVPNIDFPFENKADK